MNQSYETLIIGATLTGIGLACNNKKNSLIIERTASPGSEYVNAFNPGKDWEKETATPEGKKLKNELEERNVLCDGKAHIPAMAPILCNLIKKEKLNALFWTEITKIEKAEDVFEIEILNASGLQKISAKKIIDTTALRISSPDKSSIISKSINAILHCENEISAFKMKTGKIIDGRFPSEKFFSLPVEISDSWPEARKKLFDSWERRADEIKDCLMASTASEFAYVSEQGPFEIEKNWLHLPSTAYSNPLESFDAGINFTQGE